MRHNKMIAMVVGVALVLVLVLFDPYAHGTQARLTTGWFVWWIIFPLAILLFCYIMFYFGEKRQKETRKMANEIIDELTDVKDWEELVRVLVTNLDRVKELGKVPTGRNWVTETTGL